MIDSRAETHVREDLDQRIELVSMDRFCADITVGLYLLADRTSASIHSYSGRPDVPVRLKWLAEAMRVLGGMRGANRTVTFSCGAWHDRAARRVFLEACKLDPTAPPEIRSLAVHDSRTSQAVSVEALGSGAYRVTAVPTDPAASSRAPSIAAGIAKLADLDIDANDDTMIQFPCGAPHDELVGVLLPRAINVRAALREQEMAATKGILVAPSAQAAT